MTVMLHDKGLSTDIDWQNKDYSGKPSIHDIALSFTECANGKSEAVYQTQLKETLQWH